MKEVRTRERRRRDRRGKLGALGGERVDCERSFAKQKIAEVWQGGGSRGRGNHSR